MFNKKTLRDVDVQGKRVLVRVDFNVPLEEGRVADDTRIRAALPTLRYLLDHGAALILCSHLGRPKGERRPELSLRPVAPVLQDLLGERVTFVDDCIGPLVEAAAHSLGSGEILLLENTRFYPQEKKNDPEFARQLASLAEVFVNDAFGTAHRAHASNVGVAAYLPAVAGLLMEKEIRYLGQVLAEPQRPFVAILGGAKISDKIGVIRNLLAKADQILIGGGMANTFFLAEGYPVGDSLVERDVLETARQLVEEAGPRLRLPVDVVIADAFSAEAQTRIVDMGPIPDGWRILDIGPETVERYARVISQARTVVWNGPMGVFELPPFARGTFALAQAVADSQAQSIIGGGDSAAAIQQSGLAERVTHISTGGGASLKMLEGAELPGLSALLDAD
ncbi:MAG: phosphoglycerate kinase [Anaerolineae bacterium]|nr:MAG: phosphoglycerate kinase [Anaerolineae bacterium]